jgi:hypothetical protein
MAVLDRTRLTDRLSSLLLSFCASIPRSSDTEKFLLLTNHFKFEFQLAGKAEIYLSKADVGIPFPLAFVR